MSELWRVAILALGIAAFPVTASAQSACLPLGEQIALCPEAGHFADIASLPIPDEEGVVGLELPPFYLEASLAWVTPQEAPNAEAALERLKSIVAAQAAEEGDLPPVRRLRETVGGTSVPVAMDIYEEYFDGDAQPLAVMVVADGADWLVIYLSSDTPMAEAAFVDAARRLAGFLRPAIQE